MPFSAIDPKVHGDVIRIGIRADKAQIDGLRSCPIEYDCARYVRRYPIVVRILKTPGWNLPGGGTNFVCGSCRSISGDRGMDKVC